MLVCHCRGVSDRQIKRAVKNGACSLREVARETGAGMRCGGCRSSVAEVVREALEHDHRPSSASSMIRLELPLASLAAEG
ncbi:(2Fe-2S)-binding protein [Myxococcota bacterium]|nr:(2Fe-2S)-binding protein [Myxococcota bacterium]